MAGAIHQAMPDVTFGAVSLHLRALAEAGLVDVRVDGRQRLYRARREALGPMARCSSRCGVRPCGVSRCWPSSNRHVAVRARGHVAPGRGRHDQPHTSPPARSQRRHRGRAGHGVPLLQRQRSLGVVVGQGLDHRAARRRPRVHPASRRRGGVRRGDRRAAAAAHRVHLRLCQRRREPGRDVAGDDPSRTRRARGHPPPPVACLRRKRHARRARPGLALPALAVWQPRRRRSLRRCGRCRRRVVCGLVRSRRRDARGHVVAHRRPTTSASATASA